MGAPRTGICSPWASTLDMCPPCSTTYALDATLLEDMIEVASGILFELSGRRFPGTCTDTVRPCARTERSFSHPIGALSSPYDGVTYSNGLGYRWVGSSCGCNSVSKCGCARVPMVALGNYPVTGITEVKVDGVVLDPSLYRVDDYRYLVRLDDPDGTNPGWKCCQNWTVDTTELDTWEVTFTYGQEPPPAGVHAAAVLACELALSCDPEGSAACRLPARVTEVTREGVSFLIQDPQQLLTDGFTGITEVDMFLKAYGMKKPARVWSPAAANRRVTRAGT